MNNSDYSSWTSTWSWSSSLIFKTFRTLFNLIKFRSFEQSSVYTHHVGTCLTENNYTLRKKKWRINLWLNYKLQF